MEDKRILNRKERHALYIEAKKLHLEDIVSSRNGGVDLNGMCGCLVAAYSHLYGHGNINKVSLLEEFKAMKPKSRGFGSYWWKTTNTSKTRLKKFDLIIKQTE